MLWYGRVSVDVASEGILLLCTQTCLSIPVHSSVIVTSKRNRNGRNVDGRDAHIDAAVDVHGPYVHGTYVQYVRTDSTEPSAQHLYELYCS